ncbi:MAG TPA: sugar kinase [Nitrososphaeria archaeon]|nr:sugar kinase [Nitrososphaeria archaeon]
MIESIQALILGDINIDLVFRIDRDLKTGDSIALRRMMISYGGVGGNLSSALARLGVPAALLGAVGEDVFGDLALRELKRSGVNARYVRRIEGESTGISIVLIDPHGERTLICARGANAAYRLSGDELEILRDVRHLHLSGYMMLNDDDGASCIKLLRFAKKWNVSTSMDLEGVALENPRKAFGIRGLVDYILMNSFEARSLIKSEKLGVNEVKSLKDLLDAKALLIKLGGKGCMVVEDEVQVIPAYRVKILDSTGAGDAFNAGFIYGLLRGLRIGDAARIGNAVGAYKCMGFGARHHPSIRQLLELFPELAELLLEM